MAFMAYDRRACPRFQIELSLRYSVKKGVQTIWRGVGHTTELSRKAIRFAVPHPLPDGSRVELEIDWPIRNGGIFPIELLAEGTILRGGEHEAVASLASWEFRISPTPAVRPEAAELASDPEGVFSQAAGSPIRSA
jgi:hypothetical protein